MDGPAKAKVVISKSKDRVAMPIFLIVSLLSWILS